MHSRSTPRNFRQRGVAAVEFALISTIFFTLLIGIMEVARVLFYINTAAEVTRLGARLAVVCDVNDADIKARMVNMLGLLQTGDITVTYAPNLCTASTCESVTVSVNKQVQTFIPFVPLTASLPSFSTTLTRESMASTGPGGELNPVCL
jgi:Flp pilus assembly protein TadG